MTTDTTYNGWKNFETWNVALWLGNDEGLYNMARRYGRGLHPYGTLTYALLQCGVKETPDGVSYGHPKLDREALNEMLQDDF